MALVSNRFLEAPFLVIDFGSSQMRILELDVPAQNPEKKPFEKKLKLFKIVNFPDFTLDISEDQKGGMSKAAYQEKLEEIRNKFINKQLTEIIFENKITIKNVVTMINDRAIGHKYLEVKKGKPETLSEDISKEAFKSMPFALENAKFGWRILGEKTKDNAIFFQVLFIILPEEIVKKTLALLKSIDLKPEGVLTMLPPLEQVAGRYIKPPVGADGAPPPLEPVYRVVMVHIGYSLTSLAIFENGFFAFQRDIPIGGNTINEEILKAAKETNMELSNADAESFKRELGVLPEDFIEEIQGEKAEEKKLAAQKIFGVAEKLLSNIQLSITYHLNAIGIGEEVESIPVQKILLSGGGANLKNFPDFIEGSTEIPVEKIDPFPGVEVGTPNFKLEDEQLSLVPALGCLDFDWNDHFVDFWNVISPRKKKSAMGDGANFLNDLITKIKTFINEKMGKKDGAGEEKKTTISVSRSEWTEQDVQKVYAGLVGVLTLLALLFIWRGYREKDKIEAELKKKKRELVLLKSQNEAIITANQKLEEARGREKEVSGLKSLGLPWSQIVFEFTSLANPDLVYRKLTFDPPTGDKGEIGFTLNIMAKDKETLFKFVDSFDGSSYFAKGVDFGNFQVVNISKDEAIPQEVVTAEVKGTINADLREKNSHYIEVIRAGIESRKREINSFRSGSGKIEKKGKSDKSEKGSKRAGSGGKEKPVIPTSGMASGTSQMSTVEKDKSASRPTSNLPATAHPGG